MENIDTAFPTHKFLLDPDWIITQMNREDSDDRIIAFYESIHDAIITDGEDWYNKGKEILVALLSNNATELLVALCGWGPDKLAQRAMLKPCTWQPAVRVLDAKLIVEWDDGDRYSTPCLIYSRQNKVYGFDRDVFMREDNPTAQIVKTYVRFNPLNRRNEYDFLCVSKEERNRINDEEIFWYDPDEEDDA